MQLLMNLANMLNILVESGAGNNTGFTYIGIGLGSIAFGLVGLGEGLVGYKTIETMGRNPEMYGKLRTGMIIADALTETTGIYMLLMCILMLFVA